MLPTNDEYYHEITKQTMEDIFLPTGFNFMHKYKDGKHDFVAKDEGKYHCNVMAIEETAGFYFLGKSKDLATQRKLLTAIDNAYPLSMELYIETMKKISELCMNINFTVEPFNMNEAENLTWSSFAKKKKISSACWMNFDSSTYRINMYPWQKSSGYWSIPQIPKMIIVDVNGQPTYIQVIDASLPITNRTCKDISISANKNIPYIYVLKNNKYEIETIENIMKEVRELIIHYLLSLIDQENCVDIESLSNDDFLKYLELHKMVII